jgi:TolA-binding protein
MSARQDPPRLVDSDDPVLRAALGAGRSELPGDERMRALSAAFVARLGTGGGGGGGTPGDAAPNASGGSGASAGTAGAGGASAAAGGAGGLTMALGGAALAIVVALGVWQSGRSDAPIAAVSATPIEASAPAALPAPSAAPVPAEPSAAVDTLPFDTLPSASASAAPPPPSASPEMEMEVFKRAQAALSSGDAAGALAACAAHQQAYPRSAFAQEREVIAIDALVRLGRRGEAEARADRFARSWPSSGHNRRIDSLLGR